MCHLWGCAAFVSEQLQKVSILQSVSRQAALCWIANKNTLCLRLWHLETLRVSREGRDGSVFVSAGSSGPSSEPDSCFPWMHQCDSSYVNVIFRQTADTFQVRASPLQVHVSLCEVCRKLRSDPHIPGRKRVQQTSLWGCVIQQTRFFSFSLFYIFLFNHIVVYNNSVCSGL